jgi:hypothetical protein
MRVSPSGYVGDEGNAKASSYEGSRTKLLKTRSLPEQGIARWRCWWLCPPPCQERLALFCWLRSLEVRQISKALSQNL